MHFKGISIYLFCLGKLECFLIFPVQYLPLLPFKGRRKVLNGFTFICTFVPVAYLLLIISLKNEHDIVYMEFLFMFFAYFTEISKYVTSYCPLKWKGIATFFSHRKWGPVSLTVSGEVYKRWEEHLFPVFPLLGFIYQHSSLI